MQKKSVTFKGKTVEFEMDDKGDVLSVTDGGKVIYPSPTGGVGKLKKGADVDLTGLKISPVQNDAHFVTSFNPTCFYWFSNGLWHVYCC